MATVLPSLEQLVPGVRHSAEVIGIYKTSGTPGRFISGSVDGKVLLWAGVSPASYELLSIGHAVDKMAYHKESLKLAAARGSVIEVFSLANRKELYRFDRLGSAVLDIAFAPDGESLLIGAADGKVYRWKFVQEARAKTIKDRQTSFERYNGPAVSVSAVTFHPNGRVFFSGDWDGGLNGWLAYDQDRYQGSYDKNYFGPQFFAEGAQRIKADRKSNFEAIDILRVSDDGSLLFAVTQTGLLELWKVRGMIQGSFFQPHLSVVYALAVSPSGDKVATAGRDGRVVVTSVRRFSESEMLAKIDRTFDHELTLLKEFPLANILSLRFESDSVLLAGDKTGAVFALTVQ